MAFFLEGKLQYVKASDDLYEYEMKRTSDTLDAEYFEVEKIFDDVYETDIWKMSWDELLDIDKDGYHETIKILANKYHFEYERREKSGVK